MPKATFTAHSQLFQSEDYGLPPGITMSHTFVLSSEGNNWNCWGAGNGTPGVQDLSGGIGQAYAKWASKIYGDKEGQINDHPQNTHIIAGLRERFNGVCHNAANRLLVLAGPGVDVSQAPLNPLVLVMYGKFGFELPQFIQLVRSAAADVNTEMPGSIAQTEVDSVVNTITGGLSEEISTLENDVISSHITEHVNSLNLDQGSVQKLLTIYQELQNKRQATFDQAAVGGGLVTDIQNRYILALKPLIIDCLNEVKSVIGETVYDQIYGLIPEQAATFLAGSVK